MMTALEKLVVAEIFLVLLLISVLHRRRPQFLVRLLASAIVVPIAIYLGVRDAIVGVWGKE